MDVRSLRISYTHAWSGRRSRRSEISSSGEVGFWVGTTRSGVVGLAAAVFTHAAAFFLLPSSRFSCCCGFTLRLLRPGLLPGGSHFRLPGHLRDRLRSGFELAFGGGVVVALTTRPRQRRGSTPRRGPSARQRARLAELSKRQGDLWLHSYGLALAPALQAPPSPLCTLHSPVVFCVVTPAATALRLLPRGRAPTGEVGATTRDAPRRVSTVSLRVSEALSALALQRALWNHVRLHRHSQASQFGD